MKQTCCFRFFRNLVAQMIFLQITYDQMKTTQWYLCCWYSGDTDTTVLFFIYKTSICKHYYQASHPYNDVKKETHFYDRQLNTVGMGQDSMISNADAVEILQSCTWPCLAIGMFQEMHASLSSHSLTLCKLRCCSCHYIVYIVQDNCIFFLSYQNQDINLWATRVW